MILQPLLSIALAASLGTASTVMAEDDGTQGLPPARTMDASGGWFFAESAQGTGSIVIRHMADGEGKPGNAPVFARDITGLSDPAECAMLHYDGVLYVACVPRLMMLRDADGDGVAEQRKVIQEGFGAGGAGSGHGFGGLALGPDGRIYGTIGDAGMDFTTREGVVCRLPNRGAAFRFELDGSGFECFHTGLIRPGKITFDDAGDAFTGERGSSETMAARVVQLVEGGDSAIQPFEVKPVDAGMGIDDRAVAADEGAAKILKEGFQHRSGAELGHLLRHPDATVRLHSQLALTRKKDALQHLGEAAVSTNAVARAHGIRGLGILARCGPLPVPFADFAAVPSGDAMTGALGILVSLTENAEERTRCEALRALAGARDEAPDLNPGVLLDDDSPRVRCFAARVVAKRKMAGYFDPICQMLEKNDNKDPLLGQAGAYALRQMAPDSSLLAALAEHQSAAVRLAAVTGLRQIDSPDVAAFLNDPDPRVADVAARAAGLATPQESRPPDAPVPAGDWETGDPHKTGNPWLFIIIGMLVLTGILLYLDPRIF